MFKARLLVGPFVEKSPLFILALVLILTASLSKVTHSQEAGTDEQKQVVRQVAQKWIQVGVEQYNRGFFKLSEQSLLRAQEYQGYLTDAEREKLNELIEKTHIALLERQRILEHIQAADLLVQQGELQKAKAHLENVKDSKFLTEQERKQIAEGLVKLDTTTVVKPSEEKPAEIKPTEVKPTEVKPPEVKSMEAKPPINEQPTTDTKQAEAQQIVDLYNRSVALYRASELEKALEGFLKVSRSGLLVASAGQTAEDYIQMIIEKMKVRLQSENLPNAPTPIQEQPKSHEQTMPVVKPVVSLEPVSNTGNSFIQEVTRKREIKRSYVKIVVDDANSKAHDYISQNEFDKAKEVVESAQRTVFGNQMDLGEILFRQYDTQLKELADEIANKEEERAKQLEKEKREAAIDAAKKRKEQMEADRERRIEELMDNAKTLQKQMRYEEALGQLDSLLALDPMNNNALILKEALEDMVNLRNQLKVEKERNRERAAILTETDKSSIPYSEEITYSQDWRKIIASPYRKPEEPLGMDQADIEVYNQLDEVVDLSALTPDMPFTDAIEELKNSVEPALKIIVLWRDLSDTAGIEPQTAINMDGLPAIRLGTGLENLLQAVSGGFADLDYIVQNGVITIATVDSLPSKLVTRVYPVADLLGQPANFRMGMLGMGMMGGGYGGGGYGGGMGGYGGYGGGMGGYGGGMGGYGGGMGGYGGGGYGGGGYGGYGGGGYGGGGYGGGGYGGGGYGGGGYGGMGGYGGYGGGMGMMGGGMGMMGGGMGMMGGGMGMMGIYDYDREYRADNLIYLIEDTIEPDSWFDAGGEGSVTIYENKKLIILQTRDIHKEIETLLNEMRKSLGHQVAIETRFLVVTENFLEDIGLDVDFQWDLGGKWTPFTFEQSSIGAVIPEITKVPGSLAGIDAGLQIGGPGISGYAGYGNILDDLQVSFLVRATQAHTDATTLTAPKVTVLSGESATFQIQRDISYALPPTVLGSGGGAGVSPYGYTGGGYNYGSSSVIQNVQRIPAGTTLTITPTIDPEKKYVLLNIITYLQDLLRLKTHQVEAVIPGQAGTPTTRETYTLQVPETESSSVQTRVSVPDGGTLLLGGQKISAEVEKEAGVPILSKLPILGRLFSNRTIVKDHKILLILVKPTIILQEEREKEAIAAMESKI
jgi:Flp pilus assembly secretin CpaC/tetratricopeptide (TPR) repeat protein